MILLFIFYYMPYYFTSQLFLLDFTKIQKSTQNLHIRIIINNFHLFLPPNTDHTDHEVSYSFYHYYIVY
jgi:hypothetical protein